MGERGPTRACPICGKPVQEAYKPFCSKRCANVDLSRWLGGVYAIPGAQEEADSLEEGEAPDPYGNDRTM